MLHGLHHGEMETTLSVQSGPEGGPSASSRGPLDGIVVIEVAAFMSGPLAGVQLADLGARVIKVEPPTGDPYRRFGRPSTYVAPHWASINRGKQSVVLDLKLGTDRNRLLQLLRTADVFLANWRPEAERSLRLTDDVLVRANPRLIRASITGFGPKGPAAQEPALDTAIQARSATMDAFASTSDPVVLAGHPMDKTTALLATQAILAALYAREKSGHGDRIDLAMLDVAASVNFPDLFPARVFLDHLPVDPHNRHTMSIRPLKASDGYIVVAPGTAKMINAAFAAVDRPELAAEVLACGDQVELVTALYGQLNRISSGWTVDQLMERFRAAEVPCAPCVRMDDHFADEQIVHNELYQIVNWKDIGPARIVRYPAVFGQWPRLLAASAPPRLGEHNFILEPAPGAIDTTPSDPPTVEGSE